MQTHVEAVPAARLWPPAWSNLTVNQNVDPLAGFAVEVDLASHQIDELFEMDRPRPVPPYLRVVEPSA